MSDELTPEEPAVAPEATPDDPLLDRPAYRRRPIASRAIRTMAVDARSLRDLRPFRRLFIGQLISLIGRQITLVAVPFQVYSPTYSALDVGLLGIVQAVPRSSGLAAAVRSPTD